LSNNNYAIEAKCRRSELGKIQIDIYKIITTYGPRKIKTLVLEISISPKIGSQKCEILQRTAEDCPVKLNLEDSVDIKFNWHQAKI
tara:strand:+ start:321 stop:578 length:258 start_codon:yes stop_codon:yes gene_type:complete